MAKNDQKIGDIMSSKEYFFYEWLILAKNIDSNTFKKLSNSELHALRKEYAAFEKTLLPSK